MIVERKVKVFWVALGCVGVDYSVFLVREVLPLGIERHIQESLVDLVPFLPYPLVELSLRVGERCTGVMYRLVDASLEAFGRFLMSDGGFGELSRVTYQRASVTCTNIS
jgi:hypothetical protein